MYLLSAFGFTAPKGGIEDFGGHIVRVSRAWLSDGFWTSPLLFCFSFFPFPFFLFLFPTPVYPVSVIIGSGGSRFHVGKRNGM
jgi:hypothetical protein